MIISKNCNCHCNRISLRGHLSNWTKDDILLTINNNLEKIDVEELVDPIKDQLKIDNFGKVDEKNTWLVGEEDELIFPE